MGPENVDQAAAASATLLEELQKFLGELHVDPPAVSMDSDLEKDLGLDSLARVELVVRLERCFDVRLPSDAFVELDTPRELLQALLTAGDGASEAPLRAVRITAAPPAVGGIPEHAVTLPDVLRWHAEHQPDRVHIHLLEDGEETLSLTYRQLLDRAGIAALALQARGVLPGDRVALMLPTGVDYFTGFFAILLCGAVPVPLYPPVRRSQLAEHLARHVNILANCGAVLLITVDEAVPLGRLLKAQVAPLRGLVTPAELTAADITFGEPRLQGDDIAFLQYTSGSTGSPKGVVLSHDDLLANIRAMGEAIGAGPDDVFVSWLPLYHDMGLIGAWLGSLYFGMPLVVMSPLDFITRPSRWLQAITLYGGTLSASPNFGYELCLKRLSESSIAELDLGSWRGAFNGAEPVSPLTLERFAERFAAAGFRAEAAMPVYGLAEVAVGLLFPPLDRGPLIDRVERRALSEQGLATPAAEDDDQALRFPSCGVPLPGYEVRIAGPDETTLPERRQGRLQFRGPSATRGYFDDPVKTAELRHGDWWDSGDLAYQADGEYFLTGRVKDVIIRGGRNLYPQELEDAVGDLPGVRRGCVVAFGSPDPQTGTERLVLLAESRQSDPDRREALRGRIREVVATLSGMPPEVVELVPPHAVLKTSSGKIRRSANRSAWEQGGSQASTPGLLDLAWRGLPAVLKAGFRRGLSHAWAAWGWLLFSLLAPLAWLLVLLLPGRTLRFDACRLLLRLLARCTGTPLRVTGLDRLLPPDQPCVLVVNHASYLDGMVLMAALPRNLVFVAKEALASQRVAGTLLRRLGAEFVERFDPRRGLADLKRITGTGRAGGTLVFFPEGTFSPIPGLRPFYMGAFVTAMEAQLPVVPVAIGGTRAILRSGSWYPSHGAIEVHVGEAMRPAASSDDPAENWRAALCLRDLARQHILAHCDEPDLAAVRETAGDSSPVTGKPTDRPDR